MKMQTRPASVREGRRSKRNRLALILVRPTRLPPNVAVPGRIRPTRTSGTTKTDLTIYISYHKSPIWSIGIFAFVKKNAKPPVCSKLSTHENDTQITISAPRMLSGHSRGALKTIKLTPQGSSCHSLAVVAATNTDCRQS